MTTLLESRYRTVMRLLPRYYRQAREEEMLEVYLWDTDEEQQDQSRPTVGEVASIAALAVRSRLATDKAPPRYALLGSSARFFALCSLLLQAASALTDRVLGATWLGTTSSPHQAMSLMGWSGHGALIAVRTITEWTLPFLWTAGYFALVGGHRRLARASVVLAALPTVSSLIIRLSDGSVPPEPAYTITTMLFAWLTVVAVYAGFHRDAPPARFPVSSPGLIYMACCTLIGASMTLVPAAADAAWGPATGFLVLGVGWLITHNREVQTSDTMGRAIALAALGLAILANRLSGLLFWQGLSISTPVLGSTLAQATAVTLTVLTLTATGIRGLKHTTSRQHPAS
ncbi:hypothetical protein [Streptomyces sp. NPDC058255]|uniref:hypothetical protein n=1 Tax=Streptomyces sp. NPDC058255 TaxID=3346407 RepID=UPI0036E8F719